jgi:hypothetical protein
MEVDDPRLLKTEECDTVYPLCPDESHCHKNDAQKRACLTVFTHPIQADLAGWERDFHRTVGDRHHFRYRSTPSPDPDYSDLEEVEETDPTLDEAFTRSCVAALSNLIARRLSRAMIDLIGIEPNPGPKGRRSGQKIGQKKKKSGKQAMVRPMGIKAPNQTRRNTEVLSSRMGIQMSAVRSDMAQYQRVLSNPWDEMPVRLGGENMQPSGIATMNARGILALSGTGNTSIVVYPWAQQSLLSSGSASPTYTYAVNANFSFPGGASLDALAAEGRIIAAGIRITSIDNANNNQGVVTIGCLPRNQVATPNVGNDADGIPFAATTTATQGYAQFFNYLQTESYPLRCGASAVWRPQDPLDFTFREVGVLGPVANFASGADLTPCFVIGITGASTTGNVLVELVSHIEYTVSSGTTGVVATGDGNMSEADVYSVAKQTFKGLTDSTFEGTTKGLLDSATKLAPYAGKAYRLGSDLYGLYANTNRA